MMPSREEILRSVAFKTSRSGGKGGQNVNKVSSKVELILDVNAVEQFSEAEIELLKLRLENRLDSEGLLHIVCQEDRSQLLNKEKAIVKLLDLIKRSLTVQKKRKPTKIPKSVVLKRLNTKAVTGLKKESRKKPKLE